MVRPLARQKGVSALPLRADMCSATGHVRFVPIADIALIIRSDESTDSKKDRPPPRPAALA